MNLQKNDSEQRIDNIEGGGDEENNDKISMNVDNTDTDNSFNPTLFGGTFSASTNLFVDQNIDNSDKRVEGSKIVFNSPLQSLLDINLSVPSKEDTKKKINFINLSEENKSDTSDPLFVGESVSPNYINVGTKFASIDLFDNASSYKTYGVFL